MMNDSARRECAHNDPYAGNILVSGLGPIPSTADALRHLVFQPKLPPTDIGAVPRHVRMHHVMDVRDLHIPSLTDRRLLQTVDLMVRRGYKQRDPALATTWSAISGERQSSGIVLSTAHAAAVEGISGVGKTQGCLRSLLSFPSPIITHDHFPRIVGPLQQVVALSVEVPPSGRSADLARALMTAWDVATGGRRFEAWLAKDKISNGMRALDEWRQVAVGHFLGVLHLDEIQNLFKLSSLERRTKRKGVGDKPELSIVEDQVLRWLLYLSNSGQIPLLVSGTPDGIGALSQRLSTLERINTCGFHPFEPFQDHCAPEFRRSFLGTLGRYQYVRDKLPIDDRLAEIVMELTGGVQRIIIALWVAAHRVAYERESSDDLRLEDFATAARTWLAPLAPAIRALREGNAQGMGHYEDMMRSNSPLWAKFWSNLQDL